MIQQRGIADLFDLIVISAEEVAFVDDSEENIAAARALGIRSVLYRSTEQTITELEELLRSALQ